MYYYEIQDVNGVIIRQPTTPYDTGVGAAVAAKDELASMYPPAYPVEIRISEGRFFQGQEQFSSTYYMDAGMVRQHALKRIEEANRQEFINFVNEALIVHEQLLGQYNLGLITPLDFVRGEESAWVHARYNIESKMNV